MNYIFVYGTLKRGESNHRLLDGASFVDVGYVRGCILFDLGGCPAMMPGGSRSGDASHSAKGEIYEVSDEDLPDMLRRLDTLESEGSLYVRAKLNVRAQSGAQCECITYLFIPSLQLDERVVNGGWWTQRSGWE
jgi:gamma-glutamylcyclotransferase (GGCT)/AIG2-like uncharacterized protein YtfP